MQKEISEKIIQSEIRNMSIECEKVNGINLSQGFSDTELSSIIGDAAKSAIDDGANHYTRFDGIGELRSVLSDKLKKYNNIDADPEENIIITNGSTAGLFCVLYALFQPYDEILLFEPYYGYHLNTIYALNLTPKFVELVPPDWGLSLEEIKKTITSKTKAIILNTPTNPSGKVFSKQEVQLLAQIAKEFGLYLITDEIYEYFLYDDASHFSPASLDELKDSVITIGGYSKTFSITGWRIGYIVCNKEIKEKIGFVHDLIYVCAPAPLQKGVVQGIAKLDEKFYENLKNTYQIKRDLLCGALMEIGLTPIIPQGAYYVLADISIVKGNSSKERVINILNKTGVASVPGNAFYNSNRGDNFARFCFAKKKDVLLEAVSRLKRL